MNTLIEFINASEVREDDEDFKNPVDLMFDELEAKNPEHFAVRQYKKYKLAAGDTFCGSCLSYLIDHDLETLTEQQLASMLKFANAAASLVTTKKGAILSMPTRAEIMQLIQKNN